MIKLSHFGATLGLVFLTLPLAASASEALSVESPFLYNFNHDGVLYESLRMDDSSSPYFWLSTGGEFSISDGVGLTQDETTLITRSSWDEVSEEVSLNILGTDTTSPNIGAYSGIFFLSRFSDSNNFYYAGVRVDGQAVIKKKVGGIYYTMATSEVFGPQASYDAVTNPNLLPQNTWIRMKSETRTLPTGDVEIILYVDKTNSGVLTEVLRATDTSGRYGKSEVLEGRTYAGIRTDHMSVALEDYVLSEI